DKPVGLVWFGLALAGQPIVAEHQLFGHKGREFIRHETVRHALELGLRALG
ncbi:MAG: damage-inducible protein CinA, partial [Mesorhizobium sp.]